MARLGIVAGHSILGSSVEMTGDVVLMQRHGENSYRPPHLIDHAANMRELVALGCDRVLAIGSVGGLRPEHTVGDVVVPHDFIALNHVISCYDDARGHCVPGFDEPWRRTVIDAWNDTDNVGIAEHGVYWQTRGPRFETRVEIRLIASFADVVGMTIASECTIARELGLAYAAVCVIDNLANGVLDDALTVAEFETGKCANRARTVASIDRVARTLA